MDITIKEKPYTWSNKYGCLSMNTLFHEGNKPLNFSSHVVVDLSNSKKLNNKTSQNGSIYT